MENPYYQYFIGLLGFQSKLPFVSSPLVEFRKRLDDEVMTQINEMTIACNTLDEPRLGGGGGEDSDATSDEVENSGTIIMDVTCAPKTSGTHKTPTS